MRRGIESGRGRWWLSILLAGIIGFLIGDRHALSSLPNGLSASQNVALRFPDASAEDSKIAGAALGAPANVAGGMVLGEAQATLLSPQPMIAPLRPQPDSIPAPPIASQESSAAAPATAPVQQAAAPPPPPPARAEIKRAVTPPRTELKSGAEHGERRASRAGFLLNNAQIASIKARLHLTPDQEQMWPAVEAALRNIAYAKAHRHQHGAPGSASAMASLDPESAEVQGLKSAAVPLIMSFSDEQKNEVRSLAHVLGLDQLASEI